jgi:demethylmenaquinone methyltransferase/2-methoxy-6-polyprenyl-1,4-benzoquinol methylase
MKTIVFYFLSQSRYNAFGNLTNDTHKPARRINLDPLRSFFEKLALSWDASQPPDRDEILDRLVAPFHEALNHRGSLLEVGTGTGALIPILKQYCPDSRLVSIDLAGQMLVRAKMRACGAKLVQSDIHHLPFQPNSFNAVICHNSFPHFWGKPEALLEIKRTLRPQGKVLVLHDLSRERVNDIHRNASNPIIHKDLLPEGYELAQMLEMAGYQPLLVEDIEEHYVVYGELKNSKPDPRNIP